MEDSIVGRRRRYRHHFHVLYEQSREAFCVAGAKNNKTTNAIIKISVIPNPPMNSSFICINQLFVTTYSLHNSHS